MPAKKPAPKPITLNEEQREAVNFGVGYACLLAGPGSGKSFVLVQRYARLIRDGVSPDDLLSLSFTKTASKNLRDRVEAHVGELTTTRTAGSVTFHSLALAFAIQERESYGFDLAEFPLAAEPIANKLASEAARRHEIDGRLLRPAISLWRRRRISPTQAIRESEDKREAKQLKMALAYKAYDAKLKSEGLLDFDSMIYYMVDLLSKKPEVRERHQYQWIMADEAQDNCQSDWELLRLLSSKYGNLLCVGDPGQTIFQFRGSDSKLFLNMDNMFPGTKKLFLATNYRSTKQLVGFLKEIGPVPELSEKFTTPNEDGIRPEVRGFTNSADEAAFVVRSIKESLNAG